MCIGFSYLGVIVAALAAGGPPGFAAEKGGRLVFQSPHGARIRLQGAMGERVERNIDHWLLPAVDANPGILEMFRVRDRRPMPDIMPWAGEFMGKYLVNAIQGCRMSDRPDLREHVRRTIAELISTQAEDGYLGPFRQEERLLGHWDLWGHYHCMLALLMWHEETGDEQALDGARRIADLVCRTFLDTGKRVLDAGSPEMNMSIIHSLGWLYRLTGEERTLRMMREIETDWQSAGDYFRTGERGVEFFRTPRPRWESLHDLQGLVELYLITGDEAYRRAFVNLWTSIVQHDRHPSGAFSTSEQAVGNPYSPGSIETCCTTAWVALTEDMLRLTGSSLAADELELSTWNSVLGSQHPSGRWWTYDTPINGIRQASAHTIVFQARCGTPELNCCSVNGPRGLGAISEWAAMLDADGPIMNYYGPCELRLSLAGGAELTITEKTEYPAEGEIRLRLGLPKPAEFNLRLRIPGWSSTTTVEVNGEEVPDAEPGTYLSLKRRWRNGDTINLGLDMSPRYWAGELARAGCAAIYRGPILLAFDPKHNPMDTDSIPPLDADQLDSVPVTASARFQPIVIRKLRAADGRDVVLCDFATAGAHGTDYVAWLPVVNAALAPVWLKRPRVGERVAAGAILFEWTGYGSGTRSGRTFILGIAGDPQFKDVVTTVPDLRLPRYVLQEGLRPGVTYYWRVTAVNGNGSTRNLNGASSFTVDLSLENTVKGEAALYQLGERDLMVASPLDGSGEPTIGVLESASGIAPAPDRQDREGGAVAFTGQTSGIKYALPYFPERDFAFYAWVCPEGLPTDRLHQVFSAWCAGMDDPLRVVIHGTELFARIEARAAYSTPGVPVENGKWVHVAAVKDGPKLFLYVNGELRGSVDVPEWCATGARDFAIGANPNYTGANECFAGRLDDFGFHAQALTADEILGVLRRG